MLHAACALGLLTVSVVATQGHHPRGPAPWQFDPYARQLGAVHFPGGEAAGSDGIAAVEVLPGGAVIVAGSTFGSLGEPNGGSNTSDLFVARFGVLGNLEWVAQVGAVTGPTIPAPGGDATGYDFATDVAVAPDGSIFVTGWTSGSLGETQAGGADVLLAKFDPAGTLLWLRQVGAQTAPTIPPEPGATQFGDASGSDMAASIFVHPSGDLVIGGSTTSSLSEDQASDGDFFLARFDGAGAVQWVLQMGTSSGPAIGFAPDSADVCRSIALHPSGKIVLAGYSWSAAGTLYIERPRIFLFDGAGHPLAWNGLGNSPTTRFSGIAIDGPTGEILVAGEVFDWFDQPLPSDAAVASFDENLGLRWFTRLAASTTSHLGLIDLGGSEHVSGVVLGRAGEVVIAGSTGSSMNELNGGGLDLFNARIRRSDGFVLAMNQIGHTTAAAMGIQVDHDEGLGANGLALGPAGTLYLGGSTTSRFAEPRGGLEDVLLLRLDAFGRFR